MHLRRVLLTVALCVMVALPTLASRPHRLSMREGPTDVGGLGRIHTAEMGVDAT